VETAASASLGRRGLAFLAGVGFAAVPTVGPYLAILAMATGRLEIQRADRWWWAAALLLGLPWLVGGHAWAGLGTMAQVVAVWLIFRSASEFRRVLRDTSLPNDVGAGMLVGFAGAMALGLARSADWRLETARSAIDLFAWSESPALFGHAMLVLAALLAVVLPSPPLRVAALSIGALAALVSGAQEAVLAWLIVAGGLRFAGRRGGRATALAEWGLIALMLAVASGLTGSLGLGRTGYRIDLVPQAAGANLFRGTEFADGEWWYPLGVRFAAESVRIDGVERTGYRVTKTESVPWARLQQAVELRPESDYVLAVAWRPVAGVQPGLDGWGRTERDVTCPPPPAAATGSWRRRSPSRSWDRVWRPPPTAGSAATSPSTTRDGDRWCGTWAPSPTAPASSAPPPPSRSSSCWRATSSSPTCPTPPTPA
jgi:hypothetical protein